MANKTPYEVRLELLMMAKDYLEKMQVAQIEFAKDTFNKAIELGTATTSDWQKFAPQFTVEDIMQKASQLYSFVSKKE